MGVQVTETGSIHADEVQMRSAFDLADRILQFEDTNPVKSLVAAQPVKHAGPPIEDSKDIRGLLEWLLSQLHKYLHGSNRLDTWRTCKGGLCATARDKVKAFAPDFVGDSKDEEAKAGS